MWDELSYGLRTLRRFKLYSVAAILTLAVGIGATTAVFSVIDATLLRPLPYADPDRLVALTIRHTDLSGDEQLFPASQIELISWRAGTMLEAIEALEPRSVALTGIGDPEVVAAGAVTHDFFRVLGHAPSLGRVFSKDEEQQNAGVAVPSDAMWRNRFNADSSVLGRTIVLGGKPHEIVGIMPRDFQVLFDSSTIWTPLNPVIDPARQNIRIMLTFGRLRDGVTPKQAEAELATLSKPLPNQFPISHARATPVVTGLDESMFGSRAPALWMLGIAVAGLLILASANVGNLTMHHLSVRHTTRWSEAKASLVVWEPTHEH